ncbi:MAG: DUF2079 domain-containing protein [Clostridiales bacterium]|jgi:uncharacterized membrane protein|nr:DUF2079 domain-containing protein [Clostridiales bacterium]
MMIKDKLYNFTAEVRQRLEKRSLSDPSLLAAAAASAYIIASILSLLRFKSYGLREFITGFSYPLFWISLTLVFSALIAVTLITRKVSPVYWTLCISAVVFASALASILDSNIYYNMGLALVIIIITKAVLSNGRLSIEADLSWRSGYITVIVLAVLLGVITAYTTAFKYRTFSEATFDLGIFTQMFEMMAKTGLPLTTVERGRELTHFAVHFSPFFYLLLPGYLIWRSPFYLFFVQALGVSLGAIPVYRISKALKLSPLSSLFCSLVYLMYPTMLNGCFRDFHENKFLAVCVLYLIYFILIENRAGTIAFTLLTLSIKEDAAIYIFAIALFILFSRKKKYRGIIMLIAAAGYYLFATKMITVFGGEAMVDRFANYYLDGGRGLLSVIKTCFYDIGFLLLQVFNAEKFQFILWTFVPLTFTLITGTSPGELILLMPALVINLMSNWIYQYNVDFQYTYGSCALMIALYMLALARIKEKEIIDDTNDWKRPFVSLMLCIIFTFSLTFGKTSRYMGAYTADKASYEASEALLKSVPKDATVTAGDFLVPHLYFISELQSYPAIYGILQPTEYVVVDLRALDDDFDPYMFMDGEYSLIESGGFVELWKRGGSY